MKEKAKKGTLVKVLLRVKRYAPLIVLSVVLAALTVALTLYVPILVGRAIDLIVGEGEVDFEGVFGVLLTIAVTVGATAVMQWLMSTINNRITFRVVCDLRNDAFSQLQILPLSYIDSHPHGDTVSRIISDADQLADGLLLGFTQLFTGAVTILGTLCFMLFISWKITIVVVVLTPLSMFAARFIARKSYSMFREQSETRAEQTSLIDEMIGNQKTVQAFSYEDRAKERFDEVNERLEKCSTRAMFFSSLVNPITRFINSLVYASVGLTGALMCISTSGAAQSFTVGFLVSFLSYANQFAKPFNEISGVVTEFQNALACASRIFEIIEEEPQEPDAGDAVRLDNVSGTVELKDVEFSYSPDVPLIRGFDLKVEPGQRVAIVGPTGCGKTTVINLLMRFYDVCGGEICVEGRDIRTVTRSSLRRSYGMVLQDTWLKSGTIRENLLLGRPDATEEEMIAASKASFAHSFIKRLSNGYDTVISDDGGSLSHGQKQLLCIARVMLCNPSILILDEATSSIDTRTELKVQQAFELLMKGRTSFIVAHRLSTVKNADVILVMKDGNVIEQGKHEELLGKNGFYTKLYNSQFA